jgi:Dyp-type peroxidase family
MSKVMNLLTICIPTSAKGREGELLAEDVNKDLSRLGNPAFAATRQKFDDDPCIHFMSVSVIPPARETEPAVLIVEATGDGDEETVTREIDKRLGDELFPILARVCGVKDRDQVGATLRNYARTLTRRVPIGRRMTGLPFAGIEDFSVKEILGHAEIAKIARETVGKISDGDAHKDVLNRNTPLKIIEEVNLAITCPSHRELISKLDGQPSPSYVDKPDSPWIRAAVRKLQRHQVVSSADGFFALLAAMPLIVWAGFGILYVLGFFTYMFAQSVGPGFGSLDCSGISAFWTSLGDIWSGLDWQLELIAVAVSIALVPAIVSAAVLIALFAVILLRKERLNTPDDSDPDPELVEALLSTENPPNRAKKGQWIQNHMICVSPLQTGFFRRHISLPFGFRFIGRQLASNIARKGFLTDMGVVHFARWIVPPGTSNLVFFSNYDGSWESYFEDFIIMAADGVTTIWSNAEGFPKTRLLKSDGATDGDRFKRFSRRAMMPTPFWYAAYPEISAEQVRKNGLFVHGLANIKSMSDAEAWLEMFASMPRPEFAVEKNEIQNIAFGGNMKLPKSRVYALRFDKVPEASPHYPGTEEIEAHRRVHRSWVANILPGLTFGELRREDFSLYLGLGMSGLEKLGLYANLDSSKGRPPADAIKVDGLPAAFVQDMKHPVRQRVLKDPASEEWQWGGDSKPVDAVLLAYWNDEDLADGGSKKHFKDITEKRLEEYGVSLVKKIETKLEFSKKKGDQRQYPVEPFGFADGVSQPKVRYLSTGGTSPDSINQVETGEFVLGYRDNLGYLPTPATVNDEDDWNHHLANLPAAIPLRWPAFGDANEKTDEEERKAGLRDFSRNGSFLVIRQLKQDVDAFNDYACEVRDQMGDLADTSGAGHGNSAKYVDEEWVKSRLVGRWKNGSSLVRNPHREGSLNAAGEVREDNEFLFGESDPQGTHCPLGAHIRRANPRDSLNPKKPDQLEVSNRHRLLRRGRTFEQEVEGGETEKGTMFMCLNADIERQFEFIQQTWINSEAFHGLTDERDPIAASAGRKFDYSVPTDLAASRFKDLPSFVEMQGGGYFFLPSLRALRFLSTEATSDPAAP